MDKQGKQANVSANAKWYRRKIIKIVKNIENEKFLKRIYIIISDNLEGKPE